MCRALHVLHCWGRMHHAGDSHEGRFDRTLGKHCFLAAWFFGVWWVLGFLMCTVQFRGEQQWMLGMLSRSLWIQQCWVEWCSSFTLLSLTSVFFIFFKFYYLSSGEEAVFEFQSWADALSCGNKSSASSPSKHSLRSLFPFSGVPAFSCRVPVCFGLVCEVSSESCCLQILGIVLGGWGTVK